MYLYIYKKIVFHRQLSDPGVKIRHARILISFPALAENVCCMLHKLSLPLRNPARMNLVTRG